MLTNHDMENEGRPRNATVMFEGGSTYKPQTRCSSVVCVFKGSDNGRAHYALGREEENPSQVPRPGQHM